MTHDARKHWESIYQAKKSDELSWHQEKPETSLKLIVETGLGRDAGIIDVGAGDSKLVDNLLDLGFKNITVLDVSPTALERAKKRLGSRAVSVKWVASDLREFETGDSYDLWHDRAVLHFLTNEEDINRYVEVVRRVLKPGGYLIVSAFSWRGPTRCSGLDTRQYSEASMEKLFNDFERIKSFEEEHVTPWGAGQIFLWSVFRKKG
ncbi:MAG TPA: class I SAM-dependent methyltransferase [Candidatus Diapherotrites archaeon]|uniref:Class I SAM-dependent methyltransferase n=1 Tax=Candidatus Iainarchaeum sp. TaxID=3101447 RepID=A0A7J4JPL9_9ARCH|nr:class I SAM-dependent methyltransferase [Candidatus Diapherotrites archaeon]HIH17156.1 class I SAM-dependent methyltransferase [Candidatus Diapherotrites archaeon]